MPEDNADLKVGQPCYDKALDLFVRIHGAGSNGGYTVRTDDGLVFSVLDRRRLVPVPDDMLVRTDHGSRADAVEMLAIAEPLMPQSHPLTGFINSLNQGVRITIESLYETEAGSCDEPC